MVRAFQWLFYTHKQKNSFVYVYTNLMKYRNSRKIKGKLCDLNNTPK